MQSPVPVSRASSEAFSAIMNARVHGALRCTGCMGAHGASTPVTVRYVRRIQSGWASVLAFHEEGTPSAQDRPQVHLRLPTTLGGR
jgi:hypothetical protein